MKKCTTLLIWITTLGLGPLASARSLEKMEFPESLEAPALKLNGLGLRQKRKFGFNFDVYVAALYLPEVSTDARAIIESRGDKLLELVFLRSVTKKQLIESFGEGLRNNCVAECDVENPQLKAFTATMIDVRKNDRIKIKFTPEDVIELEVSSKTKATGEFKGEATRKNVLAAFLGLRPASTELRDGLLGLKSRPNK